MSKSAKSFEDLIVWQKAHAWTLDVYRITQKFPKEEIFGLTSQVRRSAMSVGSNIVEGFNRKGTGDKLKFYNYAERSLEEARYQLLLGHDLEFADTKSLQENAKEIGVILRSYIRKIENTQK